MLEAAGEGRWRLRGELTMRQCAALSAPLAAAARRGGEVDLAGVTAADSAALALLLEARRAAREAGRDLAFSGVPSGMLTLARLYGVEALLERSAR
ncbi:STAS domain-containing protein [Crenobacter luteus]|uniref:STAS domain-containing protein n=1 Tax=Crenobacter luteus TaxID=1452487 RepID=A0A165FHX4_9NEIS|nr:STAS domain-containing protein [Crenobacter luteus]KZE33332.1 hypothetical protein AVW16_09235 [Crenobacter luteus]